MEQEIIVETVFELVMRKMFGVYFMQIITLLFVIFMVFSGNLKKFFLWLFSFRKVSIGKVKLENGETINERRHEKRRQSDVNTASVNEDIDNVLHVINEKLDQFNKRFHSIEYLLGKVSQGTLVNSMRDDTQPIMRRLKNFRRLLATKKNGRDKMFGINLILQNKERWQDLLEQEPEVDITIINNEYYNEVMSEINKKILESGGIV